MSREITLRTKGKLTVESWPTGVAGLSIVPFVWSDTGVEPGWYRLNHDESGLTVGPYAWKSRAAVKRAAQAVAGVLDWTEPFDDLREHPRLGEVKETCRRESVHEWDLWWRVREL